MGKLVIEKDLGGIEGLCTIIPHLYGDKRGSFMETFNQKDLEDEGIYVDFVQDNQSTSVNGVLRGLHFQVKHPQAKLVRILRGEVFDVAVDIRPGSKTFGKWHGEILSEANRKQMLIPAGFAHGFLVLSEYATFFYKCDDFYHPDDESGLPWNDSDIGIEWPEITLAHNEITGADEYVLGSGVPLMLSKKDKEWRSFKEYLAENNIDWEGIK
ncbi:MAG: dTDP-4-dehydrorhamnose 3,5-epimerase [Firmicutes bacterium]|nr:dTDP-4-dehydrorhamnose 3,5-epimerase [Bacillota bacterium]